MISVIIPVHNVEKYLDRCIQSVLNNTYRDLEIILVENGSTDHSLAICKKYEEQYVNTKLIVADCAGLSHARNLGLAYATGDFISFVDADDYVSPYLYETLLNCAIANNSDFVFCTCISGSDESYNFSVPTCIGPVPINVTTYLRNTYMQAQTIYSVVWNKLIRNSIARKFTFDESLKYFEDRNYSVKCVCASENICFINEAMYYYYRGNSSSICSSSNATDRMDQVFSLQKDLQFFQNNYPNEKAWSEFANACLLQNADFRIKRAKELNLMDQQAVLKPIIRDAAKRVRLSTHLSWKEKYRFLLEHDCPSLFHLLYGICKKVGLK